MIKSSQGNNDAVDIIKDDQPFTGITPSLYLHVNYLTSMGFRVFNGYQQGITSMIRYS